MYYHFSQNNSGGKFYIDHDRGIAEDVWIEASSAVEANHLAEQLGIYFDGVSQGWDCECCGDRWYEVSEDDWYRVKTLKAIHEYQTGYGFRSTYYIHRKSGKVIAGTNKK